MGAVINTGQHDERRHRGQRISGRQQHGNRGQRPDARQDADQRAQKAAGKGVSQVLQRESDPETQGEVIE